MGYKIVGTEALVISALSIDEVAQLQESGVEGLQILDGSGWAGGSLSFLREMPFLRRLTIRSMLFPLQDVDAVEELIDLRELEVSTYCGTPLRLSKTRRLEKLCLVWREGSEGIFALKHLNSLVIDGFNKGELPELESTGLERLQILDARKVNNLEALQVLVNLKRLRLTNLRKLEESSFLSNLSGVECLEVDSCRGFENIESLTRLKSLFYLCLNDMKEIDSLVPLVDLQALSSLFFWGSTKILDGKIEILKRLPHLRQISFANRRHYDCKRESFEQFHNPTEAPVSFY